MSDDDWDTEADFVNDVTDQSRFGDRQRVNNDRANTGAMFFKEAADQEVDKELTPYQKALARAPPPPPPPPPTQAPPEPEVPQQQYSLPPPPPPGGFSMPAPPPDARVKPLNLGGGVASGARGNVAMRYLVPANASLDTLQEDAQGVRRSGLGGGR